MPGEYEASHGFDEAVSPDGLARPGYGDLMASVAAAGPADLLARVSAELEARGVTFGGTEHPERFLVDPVPRVIDREQWALLESGLIQRVRALNAFVADVYSQRAICHAGVVPEAAITSADYLEPAMSGVVVTGGAHIGVAGLDVVRDPEGEFLVLEDNLRTPSGLAYAWAARETVAGCVPGGPPPGLRPVSDGFGMMHRTLRSAAPDGIEEPEIVVLSDGPVNGAWWEHRAISEQLGVAVVTVEDLLLRGGRLHRRTDRGPRPVHVVYRRCDEDRLVDDRGAQTALGELLLGPLQAGTVGVVNAFGTGVADDKLLHAYVEDMVRFYLGQEPLLRSVPTHDLGRDELREELLGRIAELVVKPRTGHGGRGVFVGPHAQPRDRERMAQEIRRDPGGYIAQEMVILSCHPTVVENELAPRHVDLRPFVYTAGDETSVLAGGLTRVALERGDTVVNFSQQGGGKDTWVLA